MTDSTRESLTISRALPETNSYEIEYPRFGHLLVRECVPRGAGFTRATRLHTSYVNRPQEALSLPWIEKLPGEKRVRFIHGQVFVIQKYFGCQLIRAHISQDEKQGVLQGGDTLRVSTSQETSFEYVR
jgi:hypothetical protein